MGKGGQEQYKRRFSRHNTSFRFVARAPLRWGTEDGDNPQLDASFFLSRVAIRGFKLDRVHVWSGEVADQAGGVAAKLSMLAQAGANLEFIYTRREADRPVLGSLTPGSSINWARCLAWMAAQTAPASSPGY